jgi:hypothetical protein
MCFSLLIQNGEKLGYETEALAVYDAMRSASTYVLILFSVPCKPVAIPIPHSNDFTRLMLGACS